MERLSSREFARDDGDERGESDGEEGNHGQHNAQDFAAINLRLAKSPRQSGDKKYQRENGEHQSSATEAFPAKAV